MVNVVNYIVLLVLLIQFITAEPKIHIDVDSKDCSPKELLVIEGKCSRYVNELTSLTQSDMTLEVTLEVADNINNVCKSITSCFGGIQCAEANRDRATYEQICEKQEMKNYEIKECMSSFFDAVYEKKHKCTKGFDYLSKDMEIKRKAYTSGKSCFLEITNKRCSNNSRAYLNSEYEKLLDMLTIPSENGHCNSVHDMLIGLQCKSIENQIFKGGMMKELAKMFGEKSDVSALCDKLKECVEGSCYYSNTMPKEMEEMCATAGEKDYKGCYIHILLNSNSLKGYECMSQPKSASNSEFLKDKECMKTIMAGECGQTALLTFDEEWAEKKNLTSLSL